VCVCVCVFWMCEASLLFRSLKDVRVNTQKILAFVPLPFILLLFPLPLTSTGNHPFYLLVSYPSIISLSLFKKYLYIWLCWVLVVTWRDGTGAPALGAWSLSHWTIREVPWYFFWQKSLCVCVCVCVCMCVFPGVSYTEGIIFYTLFEPCICRLVYLGAHSVLVQMTFPHAFCVVAECSTGWRYPGLSNQSSE